MGQHIHAKEAVKELTKGNHDGQVFRNRTEIFHGHILAAGLYELTVDFVFAGGMGNDVTVDDV
ncbi:MAG: hypothetical protein KGL31_00025 [candidate division NC10 bacterium]|nr:hypothetical protein [candidate division NC10 bacterium]MDE2320303.1 hypothetical protein [candidate division NC10 bacterium]